MKIKKKEIRHLGELLLSRFEHEVDSYEEGVINDNVFQVFEKIGKDLKRLSKKLTLSTEKKLFRSFAKGMIRALPANWAEQETDADRAVDACEEEHNEDKKAKRSPVNEEERIAKLLRLYDIEKKYSTIEGATHKEWEEARQLVKELYTL